MNRMQWSIGGLMIAVLAVALALGAIVSRSPWVESIAITLNLGLLGLALTGAVAGRNVARTFCIGYVVFGVGYLLAVTYARESLLTEWALQRIPVLQSPKKGDQVSAQWTSGTYYPATIGDVQDGQYLAVWHDGDRPLWVRADQIRLLDGGRVTSTGHSAIGILLSCAGAWLAVLRFAAPPREKQEQLQTPAPAAAAAPATPFSVTWDEAAADAPPMPPVQVASPPIDGLATGPSSPKQSS